MDRRHLGLVQEEGEIVDHRYMKEKFILGFFLYWCYSHWLGDSVSPVCGNFSENIDFVKITARFAETDTLTSKK